MEKPDPNATVAELIDAKALEFEREGQGRVHDVWDQHPDNQCFVVSSEEALVLDIDPFRWPRMHAAIRAFEACSDFCDDHSYPKACWGEVYRDRPDIPMNMENVEAFAEFCTAYAGLSAGEAYRAWFKWEVWHFRMGYHLYPTSTDKISDTYRLRQLQSELERSTKTVSLKSNAVASVLRRVRGAVAQAGWRIANKDQHP